MGKKSNQAQENLDAGIAEASQGGAALIPERGFIDASINNVPTVGVQGLDAIHSGRAAMDNLAGTFQNLQATGGAIPDAERQILMNKLGGMAGQPLTAQADAGVQAQDANAKTAQNVSNFAGGNLQQLDNQGFLSKLNEFAMMGTGRHANEHFDNATKNITQGLDAAQRDGQIALDANINAARNGGQMMQLGARADQRDANSQIASTVVGGVSGAAAAGAKAYDSYTSMGGAGYEPTAADTADTAPDAADYGAYDVDDNDAFSQDDNLDAFGNQANGVYTGAAPGVTGVRYTPTDVFQ